jgi:DNA-binding NarL/FixJ family response regulator
MNELRQMPSPGLQGRHKALLREMTKISKIKVLIADSRHSMRDSLNRSLIDQPALDIVAAVDNGMEAILKAIALKPEVGIVDLTLPNHGGLLAIINIRQKSPGIHILVRDLTESELELTQAFRFGALGYIPINARVDDIVKIIQRAALGEAHLHPDLVVKLIDEFRQNQVDWDGLSGIEREVLTLSLEGMNEASIAHSLLISENLVRVLLGRFMEKLHTRNLVEARDLLRGVPPVLD